MKSKLKSDLVQELQAANERIAELEGRLIDIAGLKHAEGSAWGNETSLRDILEAAPDAMLTIDAGGGIIFANRQAETVFGYSKSELLGMQVEQLIPINLREGHVAVRQGFVRDPRHMVAGVNREIRALRKDGSEFFAEISLSHQKHGDEILVLAAIRDMTDRRQAEILTSAQRDLAYVISADLTEQEMRERCLQAALRVSGMDCGGIYFFDETRQYLRLIHHTGLGADFISQVSLFPVKSPSALMVLSGKNLYLSTEELGRKKYHRDEGLLSGAILPIHHQGRILGCLNIASHTRAHIHQEARAALETITVEIGNVFSFHQTNRELHESEEKYRRLVEDQEASILVLDPKGGIHYINEFGADRLGMTVQEIMGRLIQELIPRQNWEQILSIVEAVLESGKGFTTEQEWIVNDKTEWRRVSTQPIRDMDDQIFRVMVISLDITEHKRLEGERLERDERYHLLFQTMVQGVVFQDASGQIILANPAAQEILGLSIDQMQGRTSVDPRWHAIHEDGSDFPGENHPAMEALRTGRMVRNTIMGVYNVAENSYRWININAVPRFKDGEEKPYQVYTTFEDVTDRKRNERLLHTQRDLALAISRVNTVSDGLQVCLETALELSGLDSGGIYMIDPVTGGLDMLQYRGIGEEFVRLVEHIPADSPNVAMVRMGQPILSSVEDESVSMPYIEKEGLKSILALPFRSQDQVIGCLNLSSHTLPQIPRHVVQDLETLAAEVGNFISYARLQESLQESRERSHAILNAIPDLMFRLDRNGVFLDYKAEAGELYAQDKPTIIGLRNRDISPPEFAELIDRKIAETLETQSVQTFEYRLSLPGSGAHDYEARMAPSGENEVLAVVRDITNRRRLEDQIIEANERFTELAETVSDIFWVSEPVTRKSLYANPAFKKVMGMSMEDVELLPNNFLDLVVPEDRHIVINCRELEDGGFKTDAEYRIRRPDGEIRWIHDRANSVFDKEGRVIRIVGIASDITERVRAESALHESEERLRLTLAASRQGLFDLDIQTGKTIVNREYAEMLGYDPETFVETNQAWMDRLHPDDTPVATDVYMDYINGRIPEYKAEFRQRTKDGKWKWILSTGKVVEYDSAGKPVRMLGIHTDIDNLKQAEFERQQLIHNLGERVKELTALHHASRLFQNPDLSEPEIMQSLVNALPPAWQYPELTAARIIVGADEYTSTGFAETEWMQKESFQLPDGRSGAIEVSYLKQLPEEFEGPFLKEERDLIKTLVERLQTSMGRRFVEDSLRKRSDDLAMLVDAGRALSETLNPASIYPIVHRYLSRVVPCDFLVISSYDPETNLIRCEHLQSSEGSQDVSGFPPIPLEPPGHGTQSKVIRSGESLLLPDFDVFIQEANKVVYFDENGELYNDVTEDEDRTRSAILVPLKENGVVSGVLQVMSMRLNAHTQDHLRFTEALAFHVSAALSNAKLFSELEERVRLRTAEVQDLYDNAPAGYHSLDAEGRFININQTGLNWLGYERDEVIGHSLQEFITDESKAIFGSTFSEFKQSGVLKDLEFELIRKDGSVFPAVVNATAIKDRNGNFVSSRSTLFDNTERKKADQALREREENYRALFENANDVILLIDLEGKILGANPRTVEIMGYSSEELTGRYATEFIVNNELDDANRQLARLKAGERLPVYERTLIHKNGTFVETDINLSLVRDERGNPKFIQSVIRDISTRKRAEETLRLANAELERALRLKDEFLANMSHELRTPLNAVLGISESMLEGVSGPINEKQQKYLQTVMESAQHLLELINDILDLAKISAGRIQLDTVKFDIQSMAQASLRMIQELAQKKSLKVRFEIDPGIKLVWGDERRIKQMLVNLLSNAVKFTPEGGEVGMKISGDEMDQMLYFTVWDTGIGIDEKDIRHLFQPFVQLDAGLARGSQGTGLGLVLVSQMARLHGGSISITSKPKIGSRFTLTIPWVEKGNVDPLTPKQELEMPHIENPVDQRASNSPVILLVEDTEAVTMLIRDYLIRYGYRVITARDGIEGITRIREETPDLILMDVMMPELDGIETTRRIRKQLGLSVPIIALTALAMSGDRERCLEAGMNGYLSKPVNLKELLAVIEEALKGKGIASNE